jgi:hypothetical protein
MREVLEGQKGLFIKQAEVVDLVVDEIGVRCSGFEVRGEDASDSAAETHVSESRHGAPIFMAG